MKNLVKKALEWGLHQLAGPYAAELNQLYGLSAAEFVGLARRDPLAALQKLSPIIEIIKAEHPAEFGQVEALYNKYAPLLGHTPGKQ